ncbi:ATP-dependent DNA helicase [Phormidium sp. CCY1219]|uniref:ATP-dependent DNA helicase n=1 Tax=Phormidium sp. CCY1219 TaxID=2886104 RepID=UPI002D1E5643|nr:ATP-dependent DNA helicase [Phormidium sp. CCY1219]MEB3829105.1 ATP-dependent DNA helicase [Phormidium sp. CCY1219]
MIEVEVHQQLRAFLRSQGEPYWPHHLTMARLVARALRLGRSALIQTGMPSVGCRARHRLSYLTPVLMWSGPVILVAPESVQQHLLLVEIPQLQQWIEMNKPIRKGDRGSSSDLLRWPGDDFEGLLMVSPQAWLKDALAECSSIPLGIPTIIDDAENLETWIREQLRVEIEAVDWNQLMVARPDRAEEIRNARVQLTRAIFQHPPNPYECCLLDAPEQEILTALYHCLATASQNGNSPQGDRLSHVPDNWRAFWQGLQNPERLLWASIDRQHGQFTLYCSPVEVAPALEKVWQRQPVAIVGGGLDLDPEAPIFREKLGLGDLTTVKFSLDRHNEVIPLYLPARFPLPNTPQFVSALLAEIRTLICVSAAATGLTAIVVGDVPLKTRLGAMLAAEFGSRVQVEKTQLSENGILVTGWEFWRTYHAELPGPKLLAIATLPIPSLENPAVAGLVAHYKRQRLDWFRLYLLPTCLQELQRAIAPVRQRPGVVALLDNRVQHRSYGKDILAALSPLARIDYLDATCFTS